MASRLDFSQIRSLYVGTSSSTQVDTNNLIVAGNVGIGTTSPTEKLVVAGAIRSTNQSNNFGTGGVSAFMDIINGSKLVRIGSVTGGDTLSGSEGDVGIFTRGNEVVRITSAYNVGIGTTSPYNALTINRDTSAGTVSSIPGIAFKNRNNTNSIFVHSGIFADTYRDVADPHYSGGIWFTRNPEVSNLSSSSDIVFGTGFNVGTGLLPSERMRITSLGNVGIGTTAPQVKTHIYTATDISLAYDENQYGLWVSQTSTSKSLILGYSNTFNAGIINAVHSGVAWKNILIATNGGNVLIGTTTDNGYKLRVNGKGYFDNNVVITPTSESWAEGLSFVMPTTGTWGGLRWRRERVGNDGNWYIGYTGLDNTDDLVFGANNGGTQVDNIIRLTKAGNVGIGTTNPASKLHVVGPINIERIGVANVYSTVDMEGNFRFNASDGYAHVFLNNGSELVRIMPSGNVGIGTTAPNAKLDVAGGINTRNTRVNSAEKYPVGHYSFGETVFEIDPTWTEAQLQDFFNVSGVSWVADSTAPGGYAIQIDGSANVGAGEYDSGFPYIPVDNSQDDWYYMECYIKNDAGSSIQHYMGGIDFNQNFASLGGNPGSYTYNVMFNYNPGTSWTKVYGYWNGFGSSYGSAGTGNTNNWVSGTKYFTPQALFNYGLNSGIRRCYISGWKCVRVRATGNRYYSNNVLVSGNVGIGTTAPDAKLVVTGDGSGTAKIGPAGFGGNYTGISLNGTLNTVSYNFLSSTSDNHLYINRPTGNDIYFRLANNDQVTIKASGNVGIGTTAPEKLLHISGGSGNVDNLILESAYVSAGVGVAMQFNRSSGVLARIRGIEEGAWNGGLLFEVRSGNTYPGYNGATNVAMKIATNGNVGIGTTAPNEKLHVFGTIEVSGFQSIGNGPLTMLKSSYNGGAYCQVKLLSYNPNNASDADFGLQVMDSGGTLNEAIRVVGNTLNVGIGTTAPLKRLVVTTGNNTNSSSNKSDALAYFGGGNDNPNAQNISFPNPSITDGSIPGMAWWSADVMFGRYKNEAFWSIKETHGGALGGSQRDIIRSYFYDSGGYSYIDKTVIPNGNVGIGTTSPAYKLEVNGLAAADRYILNSVPTNSFQGSLTAIAGDSTYNILAGPANGPIIRARWSGGTANRYLEFGQTDNGGNYTANVRIVEGNVGIGTTNPAFKLDVSGTFHSGGDATFNGTNTYINSSYIYVGNNTADLVSISGNTMYFPGNGNVGIGTTSPSYKLDVSGSARVNSTSNLAMFVKTNSAFGAAISYEDSTTGGNDVVHAGAIGSNFYIATGYSERMRVSSSGNVIIGSTTDAGYKLDVHGEILGRDDIRILNTYALILNGTDANWRIGRNTITDSGWLTGNTMQMVVFGGQTGQGFQVVNTNGTALFEIDGVAGASRFTNALGVGVNPSGTAGRIDASNDIVAYSTSDQRLKENITPIANALDKVKALTGVEFDWKEDTKAVHGYEGHDVGVIAQEVQAVLPEAVRTNDSGYLSVRYEKMIGLLVEAMKEQQNQIDELKAKLDGLTK